MMLNPLNLHHLNRLDALEADWVTLNLEDAIAPARKTEALENIALFLSHCTRRRSRIVVRVNPLDAGGREEIEALRGCPFDAVRLSKVRSRDEIERALAILEPSKTLHLSIETAEAFRDLDRWRGIERLETVNLGILDLLADLHLPQSLLQQGNPTIDYLLSTFLVRARIAETIPVGFMYQDYRDLDGYRRWMEYLKTMGYTAAACMGPAQVEIANDVFDIYDDETIERARYIREVFEKNALNNINGFMDDKYGFIDEPIYRDALNILENIKQNEGDEDALPSAGGTVTPDR
jgi:citrate lyase subunit beta/citryl-CoA lyase